ncbi:MAG: protein phosphatase 2C domain-containing protein [Chloroflexi bacterium]|nr:protein phosphatase 2C domain-containing protein [Chloroflexota bacterium]
MLDFFRNIFGKKNNKPSVDSAVTAPLSDVQLKSIVTTTAQNRFEPTQFLVASGQSVGRQRELNEDSIFTFATVIAGNSSNPPLGLFIIADGMGGHQYGEIASNTAIRSISGYVMKKFHNSLFTIPTQPVDESLQEIIQAGIMEAQRAVLREAPGSGTTVTAALVLGQQLTIAHVGDSRAYLLYNHQRMEAITRDHSLVRRLEELGQITAAEAAVHPQRNVLYRAIGQGENLESDVTTTPFPIGGYLLICSDGLWGVVPDEEMLRIVYTTPNIQSACQELVAAANAAGGPDNISVILAQLIG